MSCIRVQQTLDLLSDKHWGFENLIQCIIKVYQECLDLPGVLFIAIDVGNDEVRHCRIYTL